MKQLSPPEAPPLSKPTFRSPRTRPQREESLLLRPRRTQRSPWTAARLADASSKLQRVSPAESAPPKGTQAKKKTQITEELCCHLFWTSRGQLASRGFLTLSGRLLEGVCVGGGAFRKLCRRKSSESVKQYHKAEPRQEEEEGH
uniref:Uncharacterized protein n=1 Tax=Rousettus aegyptiacus TaxID=9407 RepID=A0A7J8B889_ROUAE|nr:hypothetical protein HJG63_010055 [Rousettus aegyptiacus]